MSKRKWQQGRKLTVLEAFAEIAAGRPVYFRNKWTHNGWARGWQIAMLIGSASRGFIFEAIPNQESEQ